MTTEVTVVPKELYYHEVAYVRKIEAQLKIALVALKEINYSQTPRFLEPSYKIADRALKDMGRLEEKT